MTTPKFGEVQSFYKNQVIFEEGQAGDVCYLVKTGEVTIYKVIDDQQKVLNRLGPGEVFGEMGLITNNPRTAFAQASEYCDLVIIDKDTLHKLLRQSPKLVQSITLFLMKRLAATLDLLEKDEETHIAPKSFFAVCSLLDMATPEDKGINFHLFCDRAKEITLLNRQQLETIIKRLVRMNLVEIKNSWGENIPENAIVRIIVDREQLLKAADHLD